MFENFQCCCHHNSDFKLVITPFYYPDMTQQFKKYQYTNTSKNTVFSSSTLSISPFCIRASGGVVVKALHY
jgi:hypothetical protein